MECIFLDQTGKTLFVRNDMESGHWTEHEYNVTADFPFDKSKEIVFGQRIAFRDPATDNLEVFEIKTVTNVEPDHCQQITAEHIALSELSDEHINKTKITAKTAAEALATALTGTLWSVGTNTASGTQNADLSRGSVWDAIATIQSNWNVYITPRVVISAAGAITGKYLDISPAGGTFRGLRLSIRKNITDPQVTYSDENVYTALYGYGASVNKTVSGQDDEQVELTFADEVWTATSEHPAKPANQTYLEWPEKTALYGRNGRPRFGYYQNAGIDDASVLLEKTWESLKVASEPTIQIAGTAIDLHRLGYSDQPLRWHDTAIVEIEETGELFNKEIIQLDIDLVNPDNNRPIIGSYIPNIIYINRDTDKKAGGGGGGGRHGDDNSEDEEERFYTEFIRTQQMIGMVAGIKNGDTYIKAGQIVVAINDDGGTTALIQADTIDIDGIVESLEAYELTVQVINAQEGESVFLSIDVAETVRCDEVDAASVGTLELTTTDLTVDSEAASWQTYTARFCTMSAQRYFMVATSSAGTSVYGTVTGRIATAYTDTVLHYLGYPDGGS